MTYGELQRFCRAFRAHGRAPSAPEGCRPVLHSDLARVWCKGFRREACCIGAVDCDSLLREEIIRPFFAADVSKPTRQPILQPAPPRNGTRIRPLKNYGSHANKKSFRLKTNGLPDHYPKQPLTDCYNRVVNACLPQSDRHFSCSRRPAVLAARLSRCRLPPVFEIMNIKSSA